MFKQFLEPVRLCRETSTIRGGRAVLEPEPEQPPRVVYAHPPVCCGGTLQLSPPLPRKTGATVFDGEHIGGHADVRAAPARFLLTRPLHNVSSKGGHDGVDGSSDIVGSRWVGCQDRQPSVGNSIGGCVCGSAGAVPESGSGHGQHNVQNDQRAWCDFLLYFGWFSQLVLRSMNFFVRPNGSTSVSPGKKQESSNMHVVVVGYEKARVGGGYDL